MLFQSLESKVLQSQKNSELLERLIADQLGFIKKIVKEHQWQYKGQEDDDLVIAMMAFQEAVKHYDEPKGKFLGFAAIVMKRRLVDHYRSRKKHEEALRYSLDHLIEDDEGGSMNPYETAASVESYHKTTEHNDLKSEIEAYKRDLEKYEIAFDELVEAAPKNDDNKTQLIGIAKHLYQAPELRHQVEETKKLPMKLIEEFFNIQRKKLERGRKYIIAVFVVYVGEYHLLLSYIERR